MLVIPDITICNVLPFYASNTISVLTQIRALHKANVLDRVQTLNAAKLAIALKDKRLILLGWGKPEVKTIPNLFYYQEVLRIVDLLSILHKDDLYVFDIKNTISTFTEHGDPRHAGRFCYFTGHKKDKCFRVIWSRLIYKEAEEWMIRREDYEWSDIY
ncbi:hypothetical protein M3659_08645 [Niallia sp. MER TA 168]|nr:hypothetical protein [Niallia sp. MER TA 168]